MARMLSVCQKIVLNRLNSLTDFKHKDQIHMVINQIGTLDEIREAQSEVDKLLTDWGAVIIGGD